MVDSIFLRRAPKRRFNHRRKEIGAAMLKYETRHYELVLMVHPDQSEQVPGMIDALQLLEEVLFIGWKIGDDVNSPTQF